MVIRIYIIAAWEKERHEMYEVPRVDHKLTVCRVDYRRLLVNTYLFVHLAFRPWGLLGGYGFDGETGGSLFVGRSYRSFTILPAPLTAPASPVFYQQEGKNSEKMV